LRWRVTAIAAVTACLITVLAAGCGEPTQAGNRPWPRNTVAQLRFGYYLSLGDSLSQGIQPDPTGASVRTGSGYPDQLYWLLRRSIPGLQLVRLGCSGETTGTMIRGGICTYPEGSQLAAAERFLRAHRRQVVLVTIDIGANDPNSCFLYTPLEQLPSCMSRQVPDTTRNLARILGALRAAGGRKLDIIGMSYYDPELAFWRYGREGEELAALSERLVASYNRLLGRVYHRYRVHVADVFAAFHTADFADNVRLRGIGILPRNVAAVCQWTWSCAQYPRGPNEHANNIGYGIIALAFFQAWQASQQG
jgi:hypothetical protein